MSKVDGSRRSKTGGRKKGTPNKITRDIREMAQKHGPACIESRSLQDLVGFLQEVHAAGIDLFLHQQGLDTKTPAGRARFGMMSVFADFERAMIVERTKAGLARARAEGKTLGRPKVDEKTTKEIVKSLKRGDLGFHKIAALHGVGTGTVQRIAKGLVA